MKKQTAQTRRPAYHETQRDASEAVREPSAASEFEVQATVWTGLCSLGIGARGEVKAKFSGRATVRFDVAVFDGGKLIGVIEVKARTKQHANGWESTRQGARYAQFEVPVRVVYGMEGAAELLKDAANGRLWEMT